jgi:poly(ADP-ribose) glycohydrolase ARH3
MDWAATDRPAGTGSPIGSATSDLHDRARGALLGAAIGDALAAPVEGAVGVTEAQLAGWMGSPRVLRYTGLTATLMTVGEHLADAVPHASLNEHRLADVLVRGRRRDPWRGYDMRPSTPSDSRPDFGALVRGAPAAVARAELGQVAALARSGATARRPGSADEDAAVVHAVAVGLALRADPGADVPVHPFIERIAVRVVSPEAERVLQDVRDLVRRSTPALASTSFGAARSVLATAAVALLAFLRGSDDFADAMGFALRVDGRTGPVSAMTGAMAGARFGASGIPVVWLAPVGERPTPQRARGCTGERADRRVSPVSTPPRRRRRLVTPG